MKSHSKLNLFAWLFLCLCLTVKAFAQDGMQFAPFMMRSDINDWAQRVVANGGALPSQNTILAMETLRLGCIAAGLTNKIYSLCVFVPDSLIAATTPLFKHYGADPWTNINFGTTNLDINGLLGNGTTKALDTAIKAKDIQVPSNGSTLGFTVIVTESATNQPNHVIGYRDPDGSPSALLLVSSAGRTEFYATTISAGDNVITNDWGRVGYVSGNRNTNGGTTNLSLFVASPLESHKLLTNTSGSIPAITTLVDDTISVFAAKQDATNQSYSALRLSLAMVHDGFTQTESSNFWMLAKACRETLGGGTGDPVHDWNTKIVAAGGAAISSTTSNASRTFLQGLDTDDTLYRIVVANTYPPDSLTAARTPIIWQSGSQTWTNFAFGTTNLTVEGLTGDRTNKYLGTGMNLSTAIIRGFSDTSAGISVLIRSNTQALGQSTLLGSAAGLLANGQFALVNSTTADPTMTFYCWKAITVNTDHLRFTWSSNYTGFMSANRTAANAIRMDLVTNGVFNVYTNGTGNQTGNNDSNTNTFAHALYNLGPAANFSSQTISFLALTSGLTSTQASNLYTRVTALRTAYGGGNP